MKSTIAIFSLAGLLGPALSIAIKIYGAGDMSSEDSLLSDGAYELVFLLWPMQVLAILETNIGTYTAVALAVLANVLLFTVLGLVRHLFGQVHFGSFTFWLVVTTVVGVVQGWAAGFDMPYFGFWPFVLASGLYGGLTWVTDRIPTATKASSATPSVTG